MFNDDANGQRITDVLLRWNNNDKEAWNELLEQVYAKLHQKATALMAGNAPDPNINATLLVSELYLKYHSKPEVNWQNSQHFYAHAALTLRGLIVDTLRKQKPNTQLTLADRQALLGEGAGEVELLALDKALEKLQQLNPAWCRVVEFRFYLGLSVTEVAAAMELSEASINKYWAMARRWLAQRLGEA